MRPLLIRNPILNVLAKELNLTSPKETIHGMHVFQTHCPKNEYEAEQLLNSHHKECNVCGETIKNGGFTKWFEILMNTVKIRQRYASRGDPIQNIDESICKYFLYDLKIRAPFLGYQMEQKALNDISVAIGETGRHSSIREDKYFKVDLVFSCFGVQVKSNTFKRFGNDKNYAQRHKEWGLPVYWLFYDSRTKKWNNLEEIIHKAKEEIKDINEMFDD